MKSNTASYLLPNCHKLIGEPHENFYQLGLKDRDGYNLISKGVKNLISTPWMLVDKIIDGAAQQLAKPLLTQHPEFKKEIQNYSEGLGVNYEDVAFTYMIPDLLCFMSKWVPGFSPELLGCSSYFLLSEQDSPLHGRILDFPLLGSFDQKDRFLFQKFKKENAIFSFGAEGLFYPSLTAMTDKGITFALHQKFSHEFNPKGDPVFHLISSMLKQVESLEDVMKFLKKRTALTSWSFYMSFQDCRVLEVDFYDSKAHFKIHHLDEKNPLLYFNNQFPKESSTALPFGIDKYNEMRIKSFKGQESKILKERDLKNLIKHMSTLPKPKKRGWNLSTLTPSSLHVMTMDAVNGSALFNLGEAPRLYTNHHAEIKNAWDGLVIKEKGKAREYKPHEKAYINLAHAQSAYDQKNIHQAFHHIQMSLADYDDSTERNIALFYFLVFEYIEITHRRERNSILDQFLELEGKLPPYLNDHLKLFIYRLQYILGRQITVEKKDIKTEKLRDVYEIESKISPFLLHILTARLIRPRIDLLDIIYTYSK